MLPLKRITLSPVATMKGKTALVTGAAQRIGRGVAVALAEAGANVVVHYRHSAEAADEAVREVVAHGVKGMAVSADFNDSRSCDALFEAGLSLTGALDIVINSASIFDSISMEEATGEELHRNFEVNALGPLFLTRLLSRHLADRRDQARIVAGEGAPDGIASGLVVNFLDSRITDYDRHHFPYAVSKRALQAITRMTALEYAPFVRVNAVAPGLILPPAGEGIDYLEHRKTSNPLRAYGTLDQIIKSVMYLLENDFVTGQILYVDGGRHMKGSVYGS